MGFNKSNQKEKEKDFKEKKPYKNKKKEVKMPRVKGHLRRRPHSRSCVRVRPHRRLIRRSSLKKFFGG